MVTITKNPAFVKPTERKENCGRWTWINPSPGKSPSFGPLWCESWNCPACRRVKIEKLLERLCQVEIVQYVEIFFAHRAGDVRPALKSWVKAVKRASPKFEYFMASRSDRQSTTVGLFLSSGTLPAKWIEESFAFYGLTARADTSTLYRPEGRRDKLDALLNVWQNEDTFIHRVSHSRRFYGPRAPKGEPVQKEKLLVSRLPIGYWLQYFSDRGIPVFDKGSDQFVIPRELLSDEQTHLLRELFAGLAPPGTSSTPAPP